jgi:hypothetical protein
MFFGGRMKRQQAMAKNEESEKTDTLNQIIKRFNCYARGEEICF